MPVINNTDYIPPRLLKNRHLLTIFPSLFRSIRRPGYERTRIPTPDQDFLDLDVSRTGSRTAVVILHGLEGSSSGKYVMGMVRIFNDHGYDTVSMNFRGCSGTPNRQMCFYHSGETGDLGTVIRYLQQSGQYDRLHLVGFSLGGNVVLKYIGEQGADISPMILSAVALSVPCDLRDSATVLEQRQNTIYMQRFIRHLKTKLILKAQQFPEQVSLENYDIIKTFRQFDDRYTAPLHGFPDAVTYWEQCSSKKYLHRIRIPVLLINAMDDPFLGEGCFPYEVARESEYFYLETPQYGGHVGFVTFGSRYYWSEKRTLDFIRAHGADKKGE